MADDAFEPMPNGHILITFNEDLYDLRRPTVAEYRTFMEKAVAVQEEAAKHDGESLIARTDNALKLVGGWFIEVLTTLSAGGFAGVTEDLPPWIISGVMNDMINHWTAVPLVRPGNV